MSSLPSEVHMKRFSLIALVLLTGSAFAATEGINFKYQKHYSCTWLFTGTPQQAPDLYTAVNANSGAIDLPPRLDTTLS